MASSSDSDSDDPPRPAIFDAIYAFDAEALRRELAAGVDPNVSYDGYTPLFNLVLVRAARYPEERIQERLECISLLLEAGASVDFRHLYPGDTNGRTVLHRVAHNRSPAYTAVITTLVEAGADVNFTDEHGNSVLARAAGSAPAATVKCLISAGAVDLDRALEEAITYGKIRNCAPLLRAGAAIPAAITQIMSAYTTRGDLAGTRAYIEKMTAAGGYRAYERAHRQRLVAIFAPKLPHLPADMLGRVLEFVFDVGGH